MTRHPPTTPRALVSVIVRARGRRDHLADAIRSVLRQSVRRLEVIVVNTSPAPLGARLDGLDDGANGRHMDVIDLPADTPLARATNVALARATGRYLAYVDAGDVLYPRHVETLVEALESRPGTGMAYADHYLTYRRAAEGGGAMVLSKVLSENMAYDPLLLCRRDGIPLTAVLHRRDLLDRAGLCDLRVRRLVDWDLVRRLAMISRPLYVPALTCERCIWVQNVDRLGDDTRRRAGEHMRDRLLIRTSRPPKPWPGMPDVSVVLLAASADKAAMDTVRRIWRWTFAPYELLVPLPAPEWAGADTDMPNLRHVPAAPGEGPQRKLDRALDACEGDYVAVVPAGWPVRDGWLETPLHALSRADDAEAMRFDAAGPAGEALLLRTADLRRVRREHPSLSLAAGLDAAGLRLRTPRAREAPLQYDSVVARAEGLRKIGDGLRAAHLLDRIRAQYPDDLALQLRAAAALYETRRHDDQAMDLCREVNRVRPTVDSLLLEARLHRRADRVERAIALLEESRNILNGKG